MVDNLKLRVGVVAVCHSLTAELLVRRIGTVRRETLACVRFVVAGNRILDPVASTASESVEQQPNELQP